MFTGLVHETGTIAELDGSADGLAMRIRTSLADQLHEGDSIAVNGVCLTATLIDGGSFAAELMNETLARTTLRDADIGAEVNLELPLRAADRLGGHVVQGHVDGIGHVSSVVDDGFARRLTVEMPPELMRYVVAKGSIAINGVSLTVAELDERSVTVSLIPETLKRTNLGGIQLGMPVNLEVDVLAKYLERLVASG